MTQQITYNWKTNDGNLQESGERILENAAKSVLAHKPQRILDIGCGNGYLCRLLTDAGVDCIGIEPAPEGLELAKKLVPEGKFYVRSCYEDPTTSDLGKFDLIVSTEVIEHLYFPRKLVQFAKGHLNANGVFIITTPDYGSYWRNLIISLTNMWDYHHLPLWDGGHIKFWSKKTLTRLLEDEGFEIERWEYTRSKTLLFNISMTCHARLKSAN